MTFFGVANVAFNINTSVRTDEEIKVFLGLIHGKYIVTAILESFTWNPLPVPLLVVAGVSLYFFL